MFAATSSGCKEEEREHARDRRRSPGPQSGGPAGDRRDPALYAGSGQLGIEALSRGAARCVFLDENREAVNIIMRNCKACGVFDRSRVNIGEAARYLSACREQFDIVLLDPPFRNGTLEKILPAVDKCTAPGGIVLCESETGIVLPAEAGGLTLKKQYKYGRVLLWKYTKPMQNTDPAENEPKGEAL